MPRSTACKRRTGRPLAAHPRHAGDRLRGAQVVGDARGFPGRERLRGRARRLRAAHRLPGDVRLRLAAHRLRRRVRCAARRRPRLRPQHHRHGVVRGRDRGERPAAGRGRRHGAGHRHAGGGSGRRQGVHGRPRRLRRPGLRDDGAPRQPRHRRRLRRWPAWSWTSSSSGGRRTRRRARRPASTRSTRWWRRSRTSA